MRNSFSGLRKNKNPAELPTRDRTAGPEQRRGRINLSMMVTFQQIVSSRNVEKLAKSYRL
jgi:hypothetical protein